MEFLPILLVIALAIAILASIWITFTKAGEPGWAAIIPIYNYMVMARIGGKPEWYGLLCLVPCVGIIFAIIIMIEFAKSFGKDALYGIGLAFLGFIFFPLLAFGDARYIGPGGRRSSRRSVRDYDDDYDRRGSGRDDDEDDDRPRRRSSRDDDDDDDDRPRRR